MTDPIRQTTRDWLNCLKEINLYELLVERLLVDLRNPGQYSAEEVVYRINKNVEHTIERIAEVKAEAAAYNKKMEDSHADN